MATHELTEIMTPSDPVPITAEWLLETFTPEIMARLLVGFMQHDANIYSVILELECRYKYERPGGTFDAAESIADVLAHKSRFAASVRTRKYEVLAHLLQPFWNSDRHCYENNPDWSEKALLQEGAVNFMNSEKFSVKAEAVSSWPFKYGWNAEAKKAPVS